MLNGLPAHPFLVHFIVVLAPLTAVLAILCAIWPAARQRLVWLVLALAAVTLVVTPIAAEAGEWLERNIEESELVEKHAALGDTMIYFALALMVATILLAIAHVRDNRGRTLSKGLSAVITIFVIAASVAASAQVYRIGHSGAESVWSDALTASTPGGAEDAG